ncbi:MAG TPA: toll/interleukin-1 receptor domain-containing protein [Rhizomicrobium sp.]|nr:toll/interleukin-1 receptor domain-containing protein [Rhizomicrobium sp.]
MAHDVFISYSSKDKPTADATCAVLEQRSIRCWMAPRDITPGADWGESIVEAIHSSRALVLVFSQNANLSPQIKREVERAVNRGLPVIPLRIENVMPAKSLEYFLSTPHWLDAFTPPLEQHLNYLADVIGHILDGKPAPEPPRPLPGPLEGIDRRVLIGGGIGGAVVLGGLGWLLLGPKTPPTFVGHWTMEKAAADVDGPSPFGAFSISTFFKAAVQGDKLDGRFEVNDLGQYKYSWSAEDHGTVKASGPGRMIMTSDITHQSTEFSYLTTTSAVFGAYAASLGGKPTDGSIALSYPGGAQSVLVGNPSGAAPDSPLSRVIGHWFTDTPANAAIGAVKTSLDITPDGRYRYYFQIAESGMWQAADGKWTRTPSGSVPVTGTYKFDGHDRVICASNGGTTIWKRLD